LLLKIASMGKGASVARRNRIGVFVRTTLFAENEVFYKNKATTELAVPTQDIRDIIGAAIKALEAVFIPGHRYHRAGLY
jgi:DNA polymerase V